VDTLHKVLGEGEGAGGGHTDYPAPGRSLSLVALGGGEVAANSDHDGQAERDQQLAGALDGLGATANPAGDRLM